MSTSALLLANLFPNDRPSWDGLVSSSQTWTAWELKFVPLHSSMERELRASYQRGESFGSANLAMAAHGVTAVMPTYTSAGPASTDYMAQFDGHFDNLAAAATNSGTALDQLAANTTMQYS